MKKKKGNRQKNVLFLLVGFLLLSSLFLATIFVQNRQDIRQYAADPQPVGQAGTWKLLFDEEFNGTALDTNKWSLNWGGEGGNMNAVGTYAANATVQGGNLILTLVSASNGALIHTDYSAGRYQAKIGDYVEGKVYFPGAGADISNWPAFWISGPDWPAAGEHDIAEGLGPLTINYHSPSGAHNHGTVDGTWANAFHVYGIHRQADKADVYWDGKLVASYPTDDNGNPEEIIINVGNGYGPAVYGEGSQLKVDYVRAWEKVSDETPDNQAPTATPGISPTWYCAGGINCVPSISPSPTAGAASITPAGNGEPTAPTNTVIQPTQDPCVATNSVRVQTWEHEHEERGNGGISGLFEALLQLLKDLLELIRQWLGGIPSTPTEPSEPPEPSEPAEPTNPCPPGNGTTEPTTGAAPTSGTNPTTATQPTTAQSAWCTNPVWQSSDPNGMWENDGYFVHNNMWNSAGDPQTTYACSYSNWYVTSNQKNDAGAVKTYPNSHKDYNKPLNSFKTITSTYQQETPATSNGIWNVAYDVWMNGLNIEVMIWTDNHNQQPSGSKVATETFGGKTWDIWKTPDNSYIAFVQQPAAKSGTVNIREMLDYLISQGWLSSNVELYQIGYGVEIVSTDSAPATFKFTNFSITTN